MTEYPPIDLKETGQRLWLLMVDNGCGVKDIQTLLYLSCPQPVYRWLSGKTLPSVDNLYTLSRRFRVHMEDLLVEQGRRERFRQRQIQRLEAYKSVSENLLCPPGRETSRHA